MDRLRALLFALFLPALALAAASSPVGIFGGVPTFAQLPGNIPLVFTAAPTGTSATLNNTWTATTGAQLVVFSDGEVKSVTLTLNATTATWSGSLAGTPTANATVDGFTTPLGAGTAGWTSDFGAVHSTGTYWTWGDSAQDYSPVPLIIASGCSTITPVAATSTMVRFTSTATTCTPVLLLPYSPNGWSCFGQDVTSGHSVVYTQTATTTTGCTVTATTTSGDTTIIKAFGL